MDYPDAPNVARRLNWLRAGVLGANDGIVSTAGLVVGVAAATPAAPLIFTAGLAGLVAGAVSMALGEYVSVSTQRDTQRALLATESIDEVPDHPIIFFVDSLLQVGDLDIEGHLPGATAQFMSTNTFAHVEATRAAGGIGLLPAFMASRHPELIRLLPRDVDIHLNFSLAARRESLTNPTVKAVRDAIHAEVARRRTELLPPVK